MDQNEHPVEPERPFTSQELLTPPPLPDPPYSRRKDPYAEPPVKDFSHLLNPNQRPYKKKPGKRKIFIPVVIVILIVALGGGAYVVFGKSKAAKVMPQKTSLTVSSKSTTDAPSIATTSYTSAGFGATFSYPSDWQVIDNGSTSLTIDSPKMSLTSIAGQTTDGKLVVSFAAQGQIPSGFGPTAAIAVLTSQKVSYKQPSASQRAQTYLSFLQYSTTTMAGGLDAIYVTGDYGYQKDQTIPRTDMANLNPLINVSFGTCGNPTCTSLTPMTINAQNWSNSSFQTPITTIVESLAFN